jgi:ubiquinone/menaquinone biosynthesis C-methylase UbiE
MTSLEHDNPDLAASYDKLSDSQLEGGKFLVERLDVRAGERVLDVGCGTGRLAEHIAGIVGADGAVVGVDPLVDRVALARARAPFISFEVGQAEDLGAFADASFDVVCMSAVFHWVTDKPKALAEVRRVLRPGGRFGLTTIPQELTGTGTIGRVFRVVLARPPYAEKLGPALLARRHGWPTLAELVTLVGDAALELLLLAVAPRTRHHATGADVVAFLEASSFGNLFGEVPEDLRAQLHADFAAAFDALARDEAGIPLVDHGAMVIARRPTA